MRLLRFLLFPMFYLAAPLSMAQAVAVLTPIAPVPAFADLKAYLALTDAQLQSLISIQNTRNAAQQSIYQQINEKQNQLNSLLQNGTTDALTVGQLEIDITHSRKQLQLPADTYKASALAVLTPDQKAKLAILSSALQLQQTAWQAVTLYLIDPPVVHPAPLPPVPLAALRIGAPAGGQ